MRLLLLGLLLELEDRVSGVLFLFILEFFLKE
jgi:hypothetical protein